MKPFQSCSEADNFQFGVGLGSGQQGEIRQRAVDASSMYAGLREVDGSGKRTPSWGSEVARMQVTNLSARNCCGHRCSGSA